MHLKPPCIIITNLNAPNSSSPSPTYNLLPPGSDVLFGSLSQAALIPLPLPLPAQMPPLSYCITNPYTYCSTANSSTSLHITNQQPDHPI